MKQPIGTVYLTLSLGINTRGKCTQINIFNYCDN